MTNSATYAVSTVTRGMCLETRANGTLSTGVYDSTGKTQIQLWTIEQSDDKKSVAFRNVGNGQYLRSAGRGDGAKAQYGKKAWWTLEPGDAPALWWLKADDTANYLANYGGSQTKNNTVQMWASNLKGWSAALQWYVHPSKAAESFSFTAGHESAVPQREREELEAKGRALKEREQQLEAREKGVKTEEDGVAARQKAVEEKEAEIQKQREALEGRETILNDRQTRVEEREKASAGADAADMGAEGGAATQVAALRRQLVATRQELSQTKAALEAKASRSSTSRHLDSGSSLSGVASDELVRLRSRISELESQLEKTRPKDLSSPRGESASVGRRDLRPIVMQHNFGFLPRLADSNLQYPFRVIPPAATVS